MASSNRPKQVNQQDLLKKAYSTLCTEVYKEIKNLELRNLKDPRWTQVYDRQARVTTWTFSDSGVQAGNLPESKASKLKGSDGRVVIKILDKNSYDYIKTED